MIEPTTAQEIVSNVVPYLIAGGLKGLASTAWTKIKSLFSKKEDEAVVLQLEKNPTDPSIKTKFEGILQQELEKNQELATELLDLVKQLQASEQHKNIVKQFGDNNIAISGKVSNSSININQK